jgi:16S rRNA (guanine966-N2)-methyltransferase
MRIIAGRWRGHVIVAPPGRGTRPTTDRVREAWMSALQLELPGSRVLDLFAGSGALGLEALSRGAAHITFVERSSGAIRALRSNIEKLGAAEDELAIVRADALVYVLRLPRLAFDLALADPPYDTGAPAALFAAFQRRPFARQLWIEHRVSEALPALPGMRSRRYGDTVLTSIPAPETEADEMETTPATEENRP